MKKRILILLLALLLVSAYGCNYRNQNEQAEVSDSKASEGFSEPERTGSPASNPIITSSSAPTASPEPTPTEKPKGSIRINPEIGKHENRMSVTVENPNPTDDYVIKQISEKPLVETEGKVSDWVIGSFWKYYEMLPDSIRESFEADEFRILITKRNLKDTYYFGDEDGFVYGVFSYEQKMICLYGTDTALKNAVLHEFGHYLDWKTGFPSGTDEFKMICEAENTLADTNPHLNKPIEFFAEVFRIHFLSDDAAFPRSVGFILKLIES